MKPVTLKGVVLDLDGVITRTAKVHFKSWKRTFEGYLKEKRGDTKEFTYEDDYMPYVDGKPRYQGVQSFLESRGVELPHGNPTDSPEKETVCGIGNKKNVLFREVIDEDGAEIYQTTITFVKDLLARGIKVGVASSSMNCDYILKKAGFLDLFEVVIGGIVSKEFDLKGKPEPDIFVVAADNLGLNPNECVVVEDAISGVQAGRNGNFGLVLGVARAGNIRDLLANGADIAVEDMKEITYDDIASWFKDGIKKDAWHLSYHAFEPEEERLRETLTTVGNGYFGTRGCLEGEKATELTHYPGTYIAGLYNKLPSIVHKKTIYNNDFVNCPNWLPLEIKIGDSEFIRPLDMEILDYKHDLNMKDAIMHRSITFKDKNGKITTLASNRIASMHNPHLAAIQYHITPHNYSEKITIKSSLDGTVINYGVERYRELESKHLSPINVSKEKEGLLLEVQTTNSKISIFMCAKTTAYQNNTPLELKKTVQKQPGFISESFSINAIKENTYRVEKLVSIFTSKDQDTKEPEESAKQILSANPHFSTILKDHIKEWHDLWDKADYQIEGDRLSQKVVRLHIYHLLVTASKHNTKIDAGMPARGLHGEAYRGHIFWDELFILPFFNMHFPETTKAMLMYRYRRLDAARDYALEHNYKGAMYPWQTADDGSEETQVIHYNPVSGKWDPDLSCRQRHVSIAIAYNVWEYYYCTNDLDFLYHFGAEMMLEISRFWASAATYDKKDSRYHIRGIMGPDEFHEKLYKTKEDGINDNAYTNIMVGWLVHKTIEMVEHLPEEIIHKLSEKIGFQLSELDQWKDIVEKMHVIISKDGIISQFDGYLDLMDLDWNHYRQKYGNIHRMDRLLKSEGDSPNKYKVAKQADVLMTYYMLSPGQVKQMLELMGYEVGDKLRFMKKNYEYYVKRTSHGSTLSHIVHAAILKYLHTHKIDMWKWFLHALKSDIYDTQGGTTCEGIHCGVMAGTIDIIIKSFAGVNLFKDHIELDPNLPVYWRSLKFKIQHRGNLFEFTIVPGTIQVRRISQSTRKMTICVDQKTYELKNYTRIEIPYEVKPVI